MTQGIKVLRRIQLGREVTSGVAVVSTTIWRGMGTIEDQRETVFPSENVGYLSGLSRTYQPKLGAVISMDAIEATYEQICHVLEAGVKLVQTGAADGSGSGKIYTYTLPVTAANTTRTYTIEGGDNIAAEEMEYAFVSEFGLDGEAGKALMISSTWNGRQVSTSTFTGSVALPTVEEILFSKCVLYADSVGGTIGATTQSNTLLKASLKITTGLIPVYTASGQLYFSFTKQAGPEVTLSLTYEHDATSVAEKAFYVAGTARQIRLKFPGSTLTTAGTAFSTKILQIDLAGKWESFSKLDEQDGNDILTGVFRARYDSTAALFASLKVCNLLSSLP